MLISKVKKIQKIVHPKFPEDLEKFKNFFIEEILRPGDAISFKDLHSFGNSVSVEHEKKYDPNRYPCKVLWSSLVVLHDGNVAMCCVDTNEDQHMGNISDQTMKEIWKGTKFAEIRNLHSCCDRKSISACDGCNVWDPSNGKVFEKK